MSQFFVNQVYVGQATNVTEYDASLLYRIPHTNMNVWTRLVYLEQPDNVGGICCNHDLFLTGHTKIILPTFLYGCVVNGFSLESRLSSLTS